MAVRFDGPPAPTGTSSAPSRWSDDHRARAGKIKELWSTPAKAWWDGPQDPNIRILTVTPNDAEYWDSPGTVVSYVKMAAAAVTNTRPVLGDNKKVTM